MKYISRNKIYFLLVVSLIILNVFGYHMIKGYVESAAQDRLKLATLDIKAFIESKMKSNEKALYGLAAFFASSNEVTEQEFATYVNRLDPEHNFPDVQAFAFSKVVSPEKLADYNQYLEKRNFPNKKVFPEDITLPLVVLHYAAPVNDNIKKAYGFNMFSEPKRKSAMEYARDNNSVAVTDKLTLVADKRSGNPTPGIVMFYPIYKNGSDISTVESRRLNLIGFVSFGVTTDELMSNLKLNAAPSLNFQIFDDSSNGSFVDSSLLYNSGDSDLLEPGFTPRFSSKDTIIFPNSSWYLRFTALRDNKLGVFFQYFPIAVALFDILLSILLLLFVRKLLNLYVSSSKQTQLYAERLIYEDALVDDSEKGIIMTNEFGDVTVFNKTAEKVLGYSEQEVTNKVSFTSFISKKELADKVAMLEKRTGIKVGQAFDAIVTDSLLDGKEEVQWNLINKAGLPRRTDMVVRPVYDSNNQLLGYKFIF